MRRSAKISLVLVGLVVVLVAAVGAGLLLWRSVLSGPECTVPGNPAEPVAVPTVEPTVVQLQHASTINAVGLSTGIPERGRIIAVATAYQESGLRNLPNGDRDSVGLFQQRPSQGWGTAEQIQDPVYAAGKFYDALLQVADWPDQALTEAAQAVQDSAFPNAYAKWEPQATTLVRGLSGGVPLELSCSAGSSPPTSDSPDRPAVAGSSGASAALAAVLAAAQAELGGLTVTSVADGGRSAEVTETVDGLGPTAAGRALGGWAVAHALGTGIGRVHVDGRRWVDHQWEDGGSAAGARVQITTVG